MTLLHHEPEKSLRSETAALTTRNRLRIKPLWYNGLRCGQLFSDPYSGTLEYHIVPHDRYESFIDLGGLRIDVDGTGCPVLIELELSLVKTVYHNELSVPPVRELQRHRFLDFPLQHKPPRVIVDEQKAMFHIVLSRRYPVACWSFAPGAAWEVDDDSCLVGIWLADPISDPSGCRRAGWRAGVWQAYRRGRLAEFASPDSHPERGWLSLPKIFA